MKDATVGEVINHIEKSSDYVFIFFDNLRSDLKKKVSIETDHEEMAAVLERLFANSPLWYRIIDNQVTVYRDAKRQVAMTQTETSKLQQTDRRTVRGVVFDEEGEALPGVNVVVKGTTTGIVTDFNGRYSLEVADENSVLTFSYIGFNKQDVKVGRRQTIDVTLTEATAEMEEVLVVGYGAQKKESITGAISAIRTDDLKKSSAVNLSNALSGRISGLTIVQSSGMPGNDNAAIYLRGAATTNSSNPLILIDGVPRDNISVLDPNEIESVSVLKDASATSVFGVRGANGVIIVTTKRGETGKMQLSLNMETSFQSFTRTPEKLESWDYMRLKNEASKNDHLGIIYTEEDIARYTNPDKNELEQYMYPSHFYYGELIRPYAPQSRISLNMNGGTERMHYFVNAAYVYQGGHFNTEPDLTYNPQIRLDRYSFRTNVDYQLSSSLKAFLNIGSYLEKAAMPSVVNYGGDVNTMVNEIFRNLQYSRPFEMGPVTVSVPNSSVAAGEVLKFDNVLRTGYEIVNRSGYRNDTRMNFNGTYGMEWDMSLLTKGLSLKGMVSYDNYSGTTLDAHNGVQQYTARIMTISGQQVPVFATNMAKGTMSFSKGVASQYNVNLQTSLNYARVFGEKHRVGGLLLAQRDYWETSGGEIPYNVLGIAGRVTYSYDDRYLGEINAGYNGSEQFAPSYRFGFFPAVSLGWRISNEAFFKPLLPVISQLKLRGSYGKVGNDKMGGGRFLYLDKMYYSNGQGNNFYLNSLSNGYYIDEGLIGNKDLGWEVAVKKNYGIEIQLFQTINLNFDYFVENRDRILITRSMVPELQGVEIGNIPKTNMGKVDNHGFEIEADFRKMLFRDFILHVKGNFAHNTNKVVFADEPLLDEDYAVRYRRTGYPLGTFFGYEIDYSNGNGYFNSQEEIDSYVDKNGSPVTYDFGKFGLGDFKYIDQNGDGVINVKDQVPLGKTMIPEVSYGVYLGAEYKGFDFSVMFQGLGKTSSYYYNEGVWETIYSGYYFDYHRTAWTEERYANGEKITYPALHLTTSTNHVPNSFFVMDRSFIRLKNAELGFTLPRKWLNMFNISNIRMYISGQNLITWDNLRMNTLDPEVYATSSNLNGIVYPNTKMYNFGINVTF